MSLFFSFPSSLLLSNPNPPKTQNPSKTLNSPKSPLLPPLHSSPNPSQPPIFLPHLQNHQTLEENEVKEDDPDPIRGFLASRAARNPDPPQESRISFRGNRVSWRVVGDLGGKRDFDPKDGVLGKFEASDYGEDDSDSKSHTFSSKDGDFGELGRNRNPKNCTFGAKEGVSGELEKLDCSNSDLDTKTPAFGTKDCSLSEMEFLRPSMFDSKVGKDGEMKILKSRTSGSNTRNPTFRTKLGSLDSPLDYSNPKDTVFDTEEEIKEEMDMLGSRVVHFNSKGSTFVADEGVVGEVMRVARNLPENSTIGEFLGEFRGRIGEGECIKLLQRLGEEGLVMCCLYLFEWMGLQKPSLLTPRSYSVLFPVLGRAGMGEKLMVLFENLPRARRFRDVHVYNAAISGLSLCERYYDAWKIFQAMETDNVMQDHVTCSTLITNMRKSGRCAKEAWEFFERMNQKGVKMRLEVYGALIKSFCDEGLKRDALIIQSEMEKKGIPSNTIIYNTLMDAYVKSNQIEEAEGLFNEMKEKGLRPTTTTFNVLMDAYSKRMQPEIVEQLLVEMENSGLKANANSFTCLISAYGRQRKMSDLAANAFLRMKNAGIKPTAHSYTALVHAYSVGGWHEKALSTFEAMKRHRIQPSIETYTALLDAHRRSGDTQTLMGIWKSMIADKIEGTRVTFNILLDGLSKHGMYVEARDVIHEFRKLDMQPTVMTYNMLINAYARGGQHNKIPQLLKEMVALNLKPDWITYSTIIYAYVRVRDFKRAFYFHKEMVRSGQVPDPKSYQKMRTILEEKAAIKNKKDKSAMLGIVNSKMGLLKPRKSKKDEFWKSYKQGRRTGTGKSHP